MFNASKRSRDVHEKIQPFGGGCLIENIQSPSRREILNAMLSYENGEELTDRELWILEEFGGDE